MRFMIFITTLLLSLSSFANQAADEFAYKEMNRRDFILKCSNVGYGFVIYLDETDEMMLSVVYHSSYQTPQNWWGLPMKQYKDFDKGVDKEVIEFDSVRHRSSKMTNKSSTIRVDYKTTADVHVVEIEKLSTTLLFSKKKCEEGKQSIYQARP